MSRLLKEYDNPDQAEINYYIDEISKFWNGDLDRLKHMNLVQLKAIYNNRFNNRNWKMNQENNINKNENQKQKEQEQLEDFRKLENCDVDYDFEEF